jgi:hypothetical protein
MAKLLLEAGAASERTERAGRKACRDHVESRTEE